MGTTTNFGWTTPENTDAVTNGALAIRTLGEEIDSTVYDLSATKLNWKSGGLYSNGRPGNDFSQSNTSYVTFVPFSIPNEVTLKNVSVSVNDSATATSYVGVYSASATTNLPNTLIASFGSFSGSTGGIKTISTTQVLPAGLYWFAVKLNQTTSYLIEGSNSVVNGDYFATATGYSLSNRFGLAQDVRGLTYSQSASGALESAAGTYATVAEVVPLIIVEVN